MRSFLMPQGQMTPEQAKQRMQSAQAQLAGNMPTDMNSGIQAVAQALMARRAEQQAMFPQAPGGAKPTIGQGFRNMFKLGGGLF